jgi:hypothetical protein
MARRFLTVEDLHRLCAKGATREIAVDDGTIVTPQALEEAARMGVAITNGGTAAYAEPVPDRGPTRRSRSGRSRTCRSPPTSRSARATASS